MLSPKSDWERLFADKIDNSGIENMIETVCSTRPEMTLRIANYFTLPKITGSYKIMFRYDGCCNNILWNRRILRHPLDPVSSAGMLNLYK